MSTTLAVSDDGKYIIMTVAGDLTRELAAENNLRAHALGAKLEIHCYLVDLTDSRNIDSVTDNYDFAYRDMKAEPYDRNARVALLVKPGESGAAS